MIVYHPLPPPMTLVQSLLQDGERQEDEDNHGGLNVRVQLGGCE
jgi:hypothetical protein